MSEVVSVLADGERAARDALERTVQSGGVAVFPADGLYGLACDPLDAAAIARIHEIKGRDDGKPAAVMYFSPLILRELIELFDEPTAEAVSALLPGPVTLVVANPGGRYPLACREDPQRLGIRLIEGPLAGVVCPVFQSSANRSGERPPAAFAEIDPAVLGAVDVAIDGGALGGLPSTVVDLTRIGAGGEWYVLREGAMPAAELERALAPLSSPR